ncbi:hypothetical protein ATL10_1001776 [Bacillus sp. 196mf]|nr:hypothetical protein ATL10_1001776 [Bacillus sp. 196mf]SFK68739.1 hypothetical protein SAMN04488573_1011085 [Bacillus sp. 5mfcol3.1]
MALNLLCVFLIMKKNSVVIKNHFLFHTQTLSYEEGVFILHE